METVLEKKRRTAVKSQVRDRIRKLVHEILSQNQWVRTAVLVSAAKAAFPQVTELSLRSIISVVLVEGELSHRFERDYGVTKLAAPRRNAPGPIRRRRKP